MTKSFSIIAGFLIIFTNIFSCSNPESSDIDTSEWKLVWQDEFNGSGEVDISKWEQGPPLSLKAAQRFNVSGRMA